MKTNVVLAVPLLLAQACCPFGCGDNSSIMAFQATLRPGVPIAVAIAEGERAQAADVGYEVDAVCSDSKFCVCRRSGLPEFATRDGLEFGCSLQASNGTITCPEAIYPGPPFPTRDDFAEALGEALPSTCTDFRFKFWRDGGGVNRDSFRVTVDARRLITSVSDVQWDE